MNSDFTVKFDRIGSGLFYQDSIGSLRFSYELAKPDGKKLILYRAKRTGDLKPISSNLSEADQLRLKLAFERVKEYLVSCGIELMD